MMPTPPLLSLAPIPYFWPREAVLDFYEAVTDWPVDIVYLGETICPKRRRVTPDDWLAIGETLTVADKQVVISSLSLLEAGSEVNAMRRLAAESPFPVEANDAGALGALARLERPFVAGAGLNLYNGRALRRVAAAGAMRWVLPVELGAAEAMVLAGESDLPMEVLAWGRLPLAWSARCFTARAENRSRDGCGFACGDDPDGRLVRTRDGNPFLNINGVGTESALTQCLAAEYEALRAAGATVLRIVPQASHTGAVVARFDALRRGADPQRTAAELQALAPVGVCDGYWHGREGAARVNPLAAES